jgi:hypothetical protein
MSEMTKVSSTTAPVELSHAGIAALEVFAAAKQAEKAAKAAKAEAEAILREMLGQSLEATVNGIVALKVQSRSNSHIDKDTLKSAFPEAYEATLVTTPYTFLANL